MNDALLFYVVMWGGLIAAGVVAALIFWASGEELTLTDPHCTDEDLVRLSRPPIEDAPVARRWP